MSVNCSPEANAASSIAFSVESSSISTVSSSSSFRSLNDSFAGRSALSFPVPFLFVFTIIFDFYFSFLVAMSCCQLP